MSENRGVNPLGRQPRVSRVVIAGVYPEVEEGKYPVKRAVGEKVTVRADVFAEGHDEVTALLLYRCGGEGEWAKVRMRSSGNDRWEGIFSVDREGLWHYTLQGWVNHFKTWQKDTVKKRKSGMNTAVDLQIGLALLERALPGVNEPETSHLRELLDFLRDCDETDQAFRRMLEPEVEEWVNSSGDPEGTITYGRELRVLVERRKSLFSAWYELFPRSCSRDPGAQGTLKDVETLLPDIAEMGFDVLYLPPIHPIGRTNRKGKNNSTERDTGDPGSPWAIGSEEGGHTSVHHELGTEKDLAALVVKARELDIEVALDLAFQCSPDHPYRREHPSWFKWRPDGTVQFAENPPKKYEDILPLNFESDDWKALWEELKRVVLYWVERGITLFRVDNPHTKPFPFWEWLIDEVKKKHPEVLFLSEAFTRPKVMYRLAKAGFSQSYTYFTWRNSKHEIIDYLTELTRSEVAEYFRPNFWPNTPDILPEYLQMGGRTAFIIRLVLAATLSSNYGVYGPPYELCVQDGIPGTEEYLNSEKYEIRNWDRKMQGNIREIISRVNRVRRENPALQETRNIQFYKVDSDHILFYEKMTADGGNVLLIAVNLDPFHVHSGWVVVPLERLRIGQDEPYLVYDLIRDEKYIWRGTRNFIEIDPKIFPAHIFRVRRYLRREQDFDYFM